jgi:hypothetical protein
MGSLGAMQQGRPTATSRIEPGNNADKLVPEGIEGRVPYKGSVVAIMYQMAAACAPAWATAAAPHRRDAHQGRVRRDHHRRHPRVHVHDVQITKEAPNYRATEPDGEPPGPNPRRRTRPFFFSSSPTMHQKILILDFGSQVTQLIARRVREATCTARSPLRRRDDWVHPRGWR